MTVPIANASPSNPATAVPSVDSAVELVGNLTAEATKAPRRQGEVKKNVESTSKQSDGRSGSEPLHERDSTSQNSRPASEDQGDHYQVTESLPMSDEV